MDFQLRRTDTFTKCFEDLDGSVRPRITKRIISLRHSVHGLEPVKICPIGMDGLMKLKIGDWRVFLWVDNGKMEVVLHAVWHRSVAYKKLFR